MTPLFSFYQYCQRKKTFGATSKKSENATATVDGVPRLFNQTFPFFLKLRVLRYAMNVSKSTYRPSGLPAILTDGSVV